MIRRVAVIGTVFLVILVIGGLVPGALVGMALVVWPEARRRVRTRDARRRSTAELAVVLELAARSVRTGSTVPDALEEVVRSRDNEADVGVRTLIWWLRHDDTATALRAWETSESGPSIQVVAAVLAVVTGLNGGAGRGLEAGASLLRERARTLGEVRAGSSQARASSLVLSVAPLLLAGAALAAAPHGAGFSTVGPLVVSSIAIGVVLEIVGLWWSRCLVRSVWSEAS